MKNPKEGETFVGYLSKEDSLDGKDRYTILGRYNEKIGELITAKRVPFDRIKENETVSPPFTEEELYIRIAAHEVRHRVQHVSQINLFLPKDSRKAKDQHLKRILIVFSRFYNLLSSNCLSEWREFDALVVGSCSGKIWHETKDISKIAKIVKEDAEILLKKNNIGEDLPHFLFLILFMPNYFTVILNYFFFPFPL